jgi:hypothetical protein
MSARWSKNVFPIERVDYGYSVLFYVAVLLWQFALEQVVIQREIPTDIIEIVSDRLPYRLSDENQVVSR